MQVRMEDPCEADRDRREHDEPRDLVSREPRHVVMHRVDRAEQLRGELALADPPLPAERREDDVERADERPDDVVRGDLSRCRSVDRAAVLVRDRLPHDEIDHRLGDHPDRVHVRRGAVLELRLDLRPHPRDVEVEIGPERRLLNAHDAKTCSITSSIGGSSTVRSCTSFSASRRAVAADVSLRGTCIRSVSPSASTASIVLYAPKRSASASSCPSNRMFPWWMTMTRLHSASTSAM